MATAMAPQQGPVMPKSHVGFDSITTQIERKLLKRGFQFNVICVGMARVQILCPKHLEPNKSCRSNGIGEIDPDKYHICISSHRLQRSTFSL